MQLFIQRHRIVSLIFLLSVIFIPILVLATNDTNDVNIGAFIDKGATYIVTHCVTDDRDGSGRCPYGTKTCIRNNSGLNYFVPTRTLTEWNAFLAHLPSSVNPVVCDGDGYCDISNGETCSTSPGDCGACAPTCTSFTYSYWFGCDSNGNTQRAVTSSSPAGCVGGNPDVTKACCSGCRYGSNCISQTVYTSSTSCYGGSTNTVSATCASSGDYPYLDHCYQYPPVSIYISATSGCHYVCETPPSPPAGCPVGSSCRAVVFYGSSSCSTNYSSTVAVCVRDTITPSICQALNVSGSSISYTSGNPGTGTGCTQDSLLPY